MQYKIKKHEKKQKHFFGGFAPLFFHAIIKFEIFWDFLLNIIYFFARFFEFFEIFWDFFIFILISFLWLFHVLITVYHNIT